MTTLVLRLDDLKELSAALSPHVSTDGVTPVLTGVMLGGRFGNYAFASDRYTVGRFDLANMFEEGAPETEFFIPGVALKAIATVGKATLPNEIYYGYYRVHLDYLERGELRYLQARIVWDDGGDLPEMTHWMRTWLVPANTGTFPPVHRFFETVASEPATSAVLNEAQLHKFLAYARLHQGSMRISSTAGLVRGQQKLSPLLIEIGQRFKAFIQPMTAFSDSQFGVDLLASNAKRMATEKVPTKNEPEVTE